MPHQYQTISPGLLSDNSKHYDINRTSFGFGTKSDFTNQKENKQIPGAKYNSHEKNAMSYLSRKNNQKTAYGFFNNFDKYDKTCYKGME